MNRMMVQNAAPAYPVQAAGVLRPADEETGRFRISTAAGPASGGLATEPGAPAVDVRITGWGRWKTVIVPPNAHVVHTRRGHADPLHIGLGVSFRYNPAKDSFLVVPGTMQTILINAYCIGKELQGLLVQGYVQWIIADFATAYKKLDFTDVEDPMRVVNVQLREQAEAAIKDKVATMGIDEVLSDKQPIIEELTARLRSVAEGEGTDKGLGLRIVTVQIKEAVVSSRRVWENLQKPFRSERARVARLAELEAETVISARERVTERERETAQLEADAEIAKLRAAQE
ncbi:MAG TPA: SPFH domain-containing protein, partial [Kofleriaceae bacterium]|nr:SPFH domain-containing protein [Kofleriaceae bacterium]